MHLTRVDTAVAKPLLLVLCLGLFTGCTSLGKISGDIKFRNVMPGSEVAAYLASHTVAPGSDQPVRLYVPGNPIFAASGPYQPAGMTLPASEWLVATYDLNLPVNETTGTTFLTEVNGISLPPVAFYRFGARSAGEPGSLVSPPVFPTTVATAGTRFDLVETPCLVKRTFKLTGSDDDINALGAATVLSCVATAVVPEGAGLMPQAHTSRTNLGIGRLRNPGEVLDLLFRDQSNILHSGFCTAMPPQNSGFAVDDQGVAIFPGTIGPQTGSCLTALQDTVEVEVRREAGALTGYFDVNAETETDALIVAARNNTTPRTASPPLFPAGQIPGANDRWRIEGIFPGNYDVYAYTRLRGGDALSILPRRTGPNLPVTVSAAPPDIDLGSTFITRATQAAGKLVLVDPSARTELRKLATEQLPMNTYLWSGPWSFLAAWGDAQIQPNGASGKDANAYARLRGPAAASTTGCSGASDTCELDYTLLLTGMSRADATRDGSGTLATRYEYGGVNLTFGTPEDNYQHSFSTIALAAPEMIAGPNPSPITLEPFGACLGQINYTVRVNANDGTLHSPTLSGAGNITSPNTRFSPSAFGRTDLRVAEGMPKSAAAATNEARVLATLSEGARYALTPQVTFTPLGGGAPTSFSLPQRLLPAASGSVLGCGQIAGACEKINNPSTGASTLLSIGIGDVPLCKPDGSVAMTVHVNSGGENIEALTYQVDNGPEISLCAGACGADPNKALPPQGQPPLVLPNGGTITIRATSQNGCDTSYSYTLSTSCQAPLPVRKRQLAFFDSGQLKTFDLITGTVAGSVTMTPGALRYARDGSKLAIVSANLIQVLDADNLSAPALNSFIGESADAAYSPMDNRLLALLQGPTSNGSYLLSLSSTGAGGSVLIGPAAIVLGNLVGASSMSASRPRLAWSRDGMRITVGYDTRTAAGVRALRTSEWRITNGQLVAVPVRDGQFPLAADEELREFAYGNFGGSEVYYVASSRNVYSLGAAGVLNPLPIASPVAQADLHRNGIFAVAPGGMAPVKLVAEGILTEPGAAGDLAPVGGVAISDFPASGAGREEPILAVARRWQIASGVPLPSIVSIYTIRVTSGQAVLQSYGAFGATNPSHLTFRPATP